MTRATAGRIRKSRVRSKGEPAPALRAARPGGTPPGPSRVVIERISPEIDGGRFPIKRIVGDRVRVEADVFADGHDVLACVLRVRRLDEEAWSESPMEPLVNDRWWGEFTVEQTGRYAYTALVWVDRFATWRRDLEKRVQAGQDVAVELLAGAEFVEEAARRAEGRDAERLAGFARLIRGRGASGARVDAAVDKTLAGLMRRYPDRSEAEAAGRELGVVVDRPQARYSTWYELFPRSTAAEPGRHGSFRDCEARLPYLAELGFDVLYLPPIHPIGETNRKGRNNSVRAAPDDPGSPWAIGSREGGHDAIHPALGTIEDFRRLVRKAREAGIEVALDLAFQCSPDHPYVREHPEWFRHRADGSIQYAENPPKKYEDIFPINFDTPDWRALWEELLRVVRYWVGQGVRMFRVDNPHTKPFAFWEWLIAEVKRDDPDVLFLSEAFTRPKIMYRLAKAGFTQSYTYFCWRNTKEELAQYFTELTQPPAREFFRPNLWPNTPDILTEYLQWGGRPPFMIRALLASTLGASYGIYGPAFELCEHRAIEAGTEEYLHSEKYEIRHWDLDRPESLRGLLARINRIRRENPALQQDHTLRFHPIDNDQLMCYSKCTEDRSNIIVVVANLDYRYTQAGWVDLALDTLGLDAKQPYQVHDLLSDARYLWHGSRNYVQLNPHVMPAHVLRVRRRVRTERDFEYFL